MSATRHGGVEKPAATQFDAHRKVLEYLAGALDASMLESRLTAVTRCQVFFDEMLQKKDSVLWLACETPFLPLYARAAANTMNVMLQDSRSSLLSSDKVVDILCLLYQPITDFMRQAGVLEPQGYLEGGHLKICQQMAAAGLPAALCRFTITTWQAVQQLDPSDRQQQQQQQRPTHKPATKHQQADHMMQCCNAIRLIDELLLLWKQISCCDAQVVHTTMAYVLELPDQSTMAALIALTTTAPQLIKKAWDSSPRRVKPATFDQALSAIARCRGAMAIFVAAHMDSTKQQQQANTEQQQQQFYLTQKLPELLLQVLADGAGQLHTACGGVSQARQAQPAANLRLFRGVWVASSHQILIQALGLTASPAQPGADTAQQLENVIWVIIDALRTFTIAQRSQGNKSSRSGSSSSSQNGAPQQPQVTHSVLPSHLLVPAVKTLIEVVLVMQDTSLDVHAVGLELILLLLQTAVAPAAAQLSAAAAEGDDCVQPSSSSALPWPQLPAAVAAGLLHPVVAQLPQAVMYCLVQTDQQQQDYDVACDRLALLHHYGSLLITVCQSVKSKHIAAVLKSQSAPDLIVTLAAVEAVIRAQACHLAPEHCRQQQHSVLHDSDPSNSSNTSSYLVQDILQHPQDQAPGLLVPFVSKVAEALLELVQQPHQQQHLVEEADPTYSNTVLCVRMFTLLNTVLTLCQAAVTKEAGVGTGAVTQPAASTGQHAASREALACTFGVSNGVRIAAHQWWRAACSGMPSAVKDVLPLLLLLRAVDIWSCGLCQPLEALAVCDEANVASLLAGLLESVALVVDALQVLVAAVADFTQEASPSAAAPFSEPGWDINVCLATYDLAQLLQHGRDLKSALQSGVDSMEADASLSYVPQTQGSGPASKLLHFAERLHHLCEAVLVNFPARYCCSNPLCTNLTKLSEWQLVCGKSCVCAGCRMARYCSTTCQKQHWKLHKHMCRSQQA